MTYSTKVLAYSLFLCPALHSMQDAQEINRALIIAARAHNISAYRQAAREAITYAENDPESIEELSPGIHLNTITPDFASHAAALSYGIVTNNQMQTSLSAISILVSAWTLQPLRTENQDDWGNLARILTFSLNGLPLGFAFADAVVHRSWQRIIPTLVNYGMNFIPYIREQNLHHSRSQLAERLNQIENNHLEENRIQNIISSLLNDNRNPFLEQNSAPAA